MKTVVSLCFILCAAFFFAAVPAARAAQAPTAVNTDLVIPLKDMSPAAIYYSAMVDGSVAEFIAVKAPDNTVRVVVNACQACGPAGFTQIGDNFQCSACGQQFHVTVLERQKGGCNPIPVGDENKKMSADSITLPLAFLRQVAQSRYSKGGPAGGGNR